MHFIFQCSIQHYVIRFVSDLRQYSGFLQVHCTLISTNKTECHDITELLLKVALNTIKQPKLNHISLCKVNNSH